MKKVRVFIAMIFVALPLLSWAQSPCPGWVEVPLDSNKSIKEFCFQYGEDCHAIAMMYDPPNNEMFLDPLYEEYDDFVLIHPDSKENVDGGLQAKQINCGEFIPTPDEIRAKETNDKLKQDCEAKKGMWGRHTGRGNLRGCNLPTADAGKKCNDSRECESACVIDKTSGENQCYGWQTFKGCGKIESGQVLCVD